MGSSLLIVGIIVLGLAFTVWVIWAYHKSGRLKNVSGIVTVIAMIASLPLGIQLAMERTHLFSQAAVDPAVAAVQVQRMEENDTDVVYITLTDAGFSYLEMGQGDNKQIIMSQGQIEPRIAHSFVVPKASKITGMQAAIYVNGKLDPQVVKFN